MHEMPAPHPAVRAMCQSAPALPLQIFPVGLDVKQAECVRTLFVAREKSCLTGCLQPGVIPVFLSTHANFEAMFCAQKPPISIVLDLHDKGRKFDFLGLTDPMWQAIDAHQLQVIYLKLQVHNPSAYQQLNRIPNRVHILSWPLLLGGSRFHVTVQDDFEGDALFSRTLKDNAEPRYEFDWSCISAPTSDDRKAAFDLLESQGPANGFLTVSKPGHSDAAVATVPYEQYLNISRSSRACVSLNGRGPWCLKDGELFANGCFILRQWHPSIDLNPLTPRDGIHWRVFKTEQLVDVIKNCAANPTHGESICRQGQQMFRDAMLNDLWSNHYVSALREFLIAPTKEAWGDLAFA